MGVTTTTIIMYGVNGVADGCVCGREECGQVLVQLRSASGEELGGPLEVPLNVGIRELQLLCTALLPPVTLHIV